MLYRPSGRVEVVASALSIRFQFMPTQMASRGDESSLSAILFYVVLGLWGKLAVRRLACIW